VQTSNHWQEVTLFCWYWFHELSTSFDEPHHETEHTGYWEHNKHTYFIKVLISLFMVYLRWRRSLLLLLLTLGNDCRFRLYFSSFLCYFLCNFISVLIKHIFGLSNTIDKLFLSTSNLFFGVLTRSVLHDIIKNSIFHYFS